MTADLIISYDVNRLTSVSLRDNSVYDIVTIQDVNATRFKFATAQTLSNPSKNVKIAEAFSEYIVVSGVFTYNGTTYTSGDKFCFVEEFNIPNTCVVDETGYYIPISTYIPVDSGAAVFTPTQTGFKGSQIYFPDTSFVLDYEVYTTKYNAGATMPIGKYIVIGGGEVLVNGTKTFLSGEVFSITSTQSFTNTTGTNFCVKYETSTQMYFYTNYYSFGLFEKYINKIATSYQLSQQVYSDFLQITAKLNACAMYAEQDYGVSVDGIQELLDQVNNNYNQLT